MLVWIDRFRYVSSEVLARRFGVSERQMRGRLGRLAEAGLVSMAVPGGSQRRLVFLTARGERAVGRRPGPRPQVGRQWRHELAVAGFVAWAELRDPQAVVLTDREARRAQAAGRGSHEVALHGGSVRAHWPDVVLQTGPRKLAIELELTAKGSERLVRILTGYLASDYEQVLYLVPDRQLSMRVRRLAERAGAQLDPAGRLRLKPITIAQWDGDSPPPLTALALAPTAG